jgi:hypothetical protein
MDSSATAINLMKMKAPQLTWLVGDARYLRSLPNGFGEDAS